MGRARPGGRAAGCWGGSYLWLRRGGHHSPFLFGGSRFPHPVSRVRRRKQRLRPPWVGWLREGGPSRLRVRESGGRASPALSERLRPAWAGTSPAAPRPGSTRWNGRLNRGLCFCPWDRYLRRSPSPSCQDFPTATANCLRVPSPLGPARPRPRSRGPAPRDSPAAAEQARAHLPPTPPAAKPRTAPPGPASARDAARSYCVRLRGHAQLPPPS